MSIHFVAAFILTNLIEMPTAWLFIRKFYSEKRILAVVLLCNVITLPFVWIVFPTMLKLPWIQVLLLAEIFAFWLEMVLYVALFKGAGWFRASTAAVVANFLSLLIGLFV
ncbi:hypothetical protein DRN67_01260 [Candidatus Micrarchaeota archaeon]|nr:MAG: hypothetical protein DRN67_01260 [Candidatus Micrarchaeota archaeon]